MAAFDALEGFVNSLSEPERTHVKEDVRLLRTQLLAARSEDARVRLVQEFIDAARDPRGTPRRG